MTDFEVGLVIGPLLVIALCGLFALLESPGEKPAAPMSEHYHFHLHYHAAQSGVEVQAIEQRRSEVRIVGGGSKAFVLADTGGRKKGAI